MSCVHINRKTNLQMSDKIKPSEVSEVLLQQLRSISTNEQFDEVGTVLQVSDGVARIYGDRKSVV